MNFIQRLLITVSVGYVLLAIGLPAGSGNVVETLIVRMNHAIERKLASHELDLTGAFRR